MKNFSNKSLKALTMKENKQTKDERVMMLNQDNIKI